MVRANNKLRLWRLLLATRLRLGEWLVRIMFGSTMLGSMEWASSELIGAGRNSITASWWRCKMSSESQESIKQRRKSKAIKGIVFTMFLLGILLLILAFPSKISNKGSFAPRDAGWVGTIYFSEKRPDIIIRM